MVRGEREGGEERGTERAREREREREREFRRVRKGKRKAIDSPVRPRPTPTEVGLPNPLPPPKPPPLPPKPLDIPYTHQTDRWVTKVIILYATTNSTWSKTHTTWQYSIARLYVHCISLRPFRDLPTHSCKLTSHRTTGRAYRISCRFLNTHATATEPTSQTH